MCMHAKNEIMPWSLYSGNKYKEDRFFCPLYTHFAIYNFACSTLVIDYRVVYIWDPILAVTVREGTLRLKV